VLHKNKATHSFLLVSFVSFLYAQTPALTLGLHTHHHLILDFVGSWAKPPTRKKKTSTNLSSPLLSSPRGLVWWGSSFVIVIMTLSAPLVVVGSANADMFVEVDRLPKEGETIAAKSGQTFAGGKGANQASCAARLSYPTYFVGQVGKDGHASLVRDALTSAGVRLDHMNTVKGPTGHALVMLQPGGKSSIVLVQGANVSWPRLADGINRLTTTVQQLIRRAGAVLLQREVPDSVNMEAAKVQNLGLQFLIRKNLSSFFCCCTVLFLSFCCHIVSYKRLNHNQRQDALIRGCIILATSWYISQNLQERWPYLLLSWMDSEFKVLKNIVLAQHAIDQLHIRPHLLRDY
jgi:hypothetical protein